MKWSLPVLIAVCASLGLRAYPGPEPGLGADLGGADRLGLRAHPGTGPGRPEPRAGIGHGLGLRAHPGTGPAGFSGPEPGGAGHHAIGEIYDEERTVVVSGEVESFLFGNPHSLLHVRVLDDGGRARTWAVEWRAADRLSRAGLTGEALAPGDAVTLCGHPGRDPAAYRLYLLNVARRAAGFGSSADARAALCAREARPEIADLPPRERAGGRAAR